MTEGTVTGLEWCPFCGGCPALVHEKLGVLWFGFCMECGAKGPERFVRADAYREWNRRAAQGASDAR